MLSVYLKSFQFIHNKTPRNFGSKIKMFQSRQCFEKWILQTGLKQTCCHVIQIQRLTTEAYHKKLNWFYDHRAIYLYSCGLVFLVGQVKVKVVEIFVPFGKSRRTPFLRNNKSAVWKSYAQSQPIAKCQWCPPTYSQFHAPAIARLVLLEMDSS